MPWSQVARQNGSDIVKHTFTWVADGSGNATVVSGVPISGEILRVVFVPGTPAPTVAYVVKLNDADAINVLALQGEAVIALSATVPSTICPGVAIKDGTVVSIVPIAVDGLLTLVVSAAGAGGAGKVIVYVR